MAIGALRQHGGSIIHTTLPDEIEEQLRRPLEQLEG